MEGKEEGRVGKIQRMYEAGQARAGSGSGGQSQRRPDRGRAESRCAPAGCIGEKRQSVRRPRTTAPVLRERVCVRWVVIGRAGRKGSRTGEMAGMSQGGRQAADPPAWTMWRGAAKTGQHRRRGSPMEALQLDGRDSGWGREGKGTKRRRDGAHAVRASTQLAAKWEDESTSGPAKTHGTVPEQAGR